MLAGLLLLLIKIHLGSSFSHYSLSKNKTITKQKKLIPSGSYKLRTFASD